jgi:hypothetical protein
MTKTVIVLNLAVSLPAALVLIATALLMIPKAPVLPGEGRADWRGPVGRDLDGHRIQRTAASIATATNSSAR